MEPLNEKHLTVYSLENVQSLLAFLFLTHKRHGERVSVSLADQEPPFALEGHSMGQVLNVRTLFGEHWFT